MNNRQNIGESIVKVRKINELYICKIILVFQNLAIFFPDIIKAITSIQLMCLILYLLYFIMFDKKIRVFKFLIVWGVYLLTVLVNMLCGGNFSFIVVFIINNLLLLLLLNMPNLIETEMKIMKSFTIVHLIASVAVYLLPQGVIDSIYRIILGSSFSSNYDWRVAQHVNPGITTQPGVNAMNLSLLCLICVAEIILLNKKKFIRIVCMLISFMMILTTAKRSAILITLLTIIIFYIYINCHKFKKITLNKLIVNLCVIIGCVLIGRYVYTSTDILQSLINKINTLESVQDISNGRFKIWTLALEQLKKNPICGVGLKKMYGILGVDVHNTYLQILVETGIVGFTFFILGLLIILKVSVLKMRYVLFIGADDGEKVATGIGFMILLFLLIYGIIGNTFIDYFPIMLFCMSVFMINPILKERE